jgi:hypothetical protein
MILSAQSVGESVRKALLDTAKSTIDEFAGAALAAFGEVALGYVRSCGSGGARALGDSAAAAYAHTLSGDLVEVTDAQGITIGNVHVATQLARFASGDPAVRTPIGTISVEHPFPFTIGESGRLSASGTLTLHADFTLDEVTKRIAPHTWGRIQLILDWTTEAKPGPSL